MRFVTPRNTIIASFLVAYSVFIFTQGYATGFRSSIEQQAINSELHKADFTPSSESARQTCVYAFLRNQNTRNEHVEIRIDDAQGKGRSFDSFLCWIKYSTVERHKKGIHFQQGNVEYFSLSEPKQLEYNHLDLDEFNLLLESYNSDAK